jgi:hypothetical protein
MRRWLDGDLDGVDPRTELPLLRDALVAAVEHDQGILALVEALAARDPVACAELLLGPRAIAHLRVADATLAVADAIAPVLPPSALARRLVDLVPASLPAVQRWALDRHADAAWAWRLDRSERPPGLAALDRLAAADPVGAVERAIALGLVGAVAARAAAGDRVALRALVEHDAPEPGQRAVAAWLDYGRTEPVVAWVAAWWGPDVEPWLAGVAAALRTPEGLQRLRAAAADCPAVVEAVEAAASAPR